MSKTTRDKLLEQAHVLFARKGFYGTSINDVAAEVSVSKQGLLHHFPSKEKLYAEVLKGAADQLMVMVEQARQISDNPQLQLQSIMQQMSREEEESIRVILLLCRELLDNRDRAETAQQWFLKPFLTELETMVINGQQQGLFDDGVHPLSYIYQLLGAIQYYLMSLPTLQQLYTAKQHKEHQQQHIRLLELTMQRVLVDPVS
ncbi:MAG: TetR/AcrR family transcriptional regulator [Candidatus Pelagadaptatus aseana]|uniref:TetR/AcrR family transcriptional regulator n=1 Tax=Candidatus Pelagadaptatus aseana TaxID=3120508 RepID=UPI0039B1AA57